MIRNSLENFARERHFDDENAELLSSKNDLICVTFLLLESYRNARKNRKNVTKEHRGAEYCQNKARFLSVL